VTVADLIGEKREAVLRLAAQHGANNVRVIGSVARGEGRPESDLDLLVNWAENTSLLDHAALAIELEQVLGRKVDIASDGWLRPAIRDSVYKDAVPL